ncbi:hypothetical protein Q0M94_28390 (plasmid) [Deinococcus radiomollis]|uniref:hypothetical protein n=1 Tax=Deinococcus radiomollis TaxID=468916 RepID=UPI00389197A1
MSLTQKRPVLDARPSPADLAQMRSLSTERMRTLYDISPDWNPDAHVDQKLLDRILRAEGTPRAIETFSKNTGKMDDYTYWYTLGTLWVSYSGHSLLTTWRHLLSSDRPNRHTSLMKPSEVAALAEMPDVIVAYRAHRKGERDWLSYTLDQQIAERFARERKHQDIRRYTIHKSHVLAYFTRRQEQELMVLDPAHALTF